MTPALKLHPLRTAVGREVANASISEILASPALQQQCREALNEHGLLLFAKQQLTPAQEAEFAKLFPWDDSVPMLSECAGPFDTAQSTGVTGIPAGGSMPVDRWKLPALPMVQCQGAGPVRDHHGVPDGTLCASQSFAEWHTDGVHDTPRSTQPPVVTAMYCLATPKQGGETLFASARVGLELLPEALWRASSLESTEEEPDTFPSSRPVGAPSSRTRPRRRLRRARRGHVPDMSEAACVGLTAVFDGRFREMVPGGTRATPHECAPDGTPPEEAFPERHFLATS